MSRTSHDLRSAQWYGDWAAYIRGENREARIRATQKRSKDRVRIDTRQLLDELDAMTEPEITAEAWLDIEREIHSEERDNWEWFRYGAPYDDDAYEDPWDAYDGTEAIEEYDERYAFDDECERYAHARAPLGW